MTCPVSLRRRHQLRMSVAVRCASLLWASWQEIPKIWCQSAIRFLKRASALKAGLRVISETPLSDLGSDRIHRSGHGGRVSDRKRGGKKQTKTQKTFTVLSHTHNHTSSNERYHVGHLQLGLEKCLWEAWSHGKSQKPSVKYLIPLFTHSSADFWQ